MKSQKILLYGLSYFLMILLMNNILLLKNISLVSVVSFSKAINWKFSIFQVKIISQQNKISKTSRSRGNTLFSSTEI